MYPQFARFLSLFSLLCLGLSLVLAQEGSGSLPAGEDQEDYQSSFDEQIIFQEARISSRPHILTHSHARARDTDTTLMFRAGVR